MKQHCADERSGKLHVLPSSASSQMETSTRTARTLRKAAVDVLFRQEAVLIGDMDIVPEHRVAYLFGEDAVGYVRRIESAGECKYMRGYHFGDFTLLTVTFEGFQAAASYHNAQQIRKEAAL